MSPGDLELDALFEDHGGYPGWPSDEMFATGVATYPRCFPAQPPLSFWQRLRRRNALTSHVTLPLTADPPHSFLFSFLTLLTGGLKGKTMTPTFSDVLWLPLSTSWFRWILGTSPWTPDPVHVASALVPLLCFLGLSPTGSRSR